MTFSETVEKHLRAIRDHDLPSLIETLPDEKEGLLLIMSDGRLVRTVREFVALHRDWFGSPTWTLTAQKFIRWSRPSWASPWERPCLSQ
jgi:hypothetical protein